MLRNLLGEVMRRRLWPIPFVALLVAIAAPLLFLKSAPPDAPPASLAAPAAAPAGELPARAQRLLTGREAQGVASRTARSRRSDPFQGPASDAESSSAPAGDASAKQSSPPAPDATAGAQASVTTPSSPAVTAPRPTTPGAPPQPEGNDEGAPISPPMRLIDVRFGERRPARMYRRIPRLQTFVAEGRVVAIFVKYSPTRDKAVFAISPGTLVDGQLECRRKAGLCRYIDVPAGKGVRLTTRGSDGGRVTRRLDVHRIVRPSQSGTAATASSAPANGSCLLDELLALGAGDLPPAGDACKG